MQYSYIYSLVEFGVDMLARWPKLPRSDTFGT
jgi:hypothetical protein